MEDRRRPRGGSAPRPSRSTRSVRSPGSIRRDLTKPQVDWFHSDMAHEPVSRRGVVLFILGLGALAGVGKLVDYQLINEKRYRQEADNRRLLSMPIFAKRGTIYDRNGNVLATSAECKNVYANPKLVEDVDKAVEALAEVLDLDGDAVRENLERDTTFVYIKRQVDDEEVELLRERGIEGIEFEPAIKRVYPYGNLASQVLGAVNIDNKGITGLEAYYDDILTGQNGSIVRERGLDGSFIAGGAYKKEPAKDGIDIVISIDVDIQRTAEDAVARAVEDTGAKNGSAIVCDPTTGEILAACSNPTYDQADLSSARTEDMNLRVVTDAYEPGSVFKALVCGMGADLGVVDPNDTFSVPASIQVGDDTVRDSDERDYQMNMDVREIMRRSSNVGMVLVGQKIGADDFASYIEKYQLGKSTGCDFPGESGGIVRDRASYDGSSLGSMSFGQGLAVPPIQVLRAMTAIANGGVMSTPHFLKSKQGEEVDWSAKQRRAISAEAAAQVASMMVTVVDEGTGDGAQISGYTVAGKTGTAERASDEGGYQKNNYMASFLGFISPDDPRVMAYVTLDGTPAGSSEATPPTAKILQSAIDSMKIMPDR